MGKKTCSDNTRAMLQAYGYTVRTLAIDPESVPQHSPAYSLWQTRPWLRDYTTLNRCILGVDMNFLFSQLEPGEMKAERKRREAVQVDKERKRAEKKVKWDAEAAGLHIQI